jgi:uncharacterized protein (TIGR02757 family)
MIPKATLQRLYRKYNRRCYVDPDPLALLYQYKHVRDREIAGLIASSLAYGRVAQIMKSVKRVLDPMHPSPFAFVSQASPCAIRKTFSGFKHRFTIDTEVASLIINVKKTLRKYGSLNECFISGIHRPHTNILPSLTTFVEKLNPENNYLLPSPKKGSACKRLNLYLRWMVRKDAVDPGGWKGIPRSALLIPLDTHMAAISRAMRWTARKSADMRMVLDVTQSFKNIEPSDPVKYDFTLTRFGIHPDLNPRNLLKLLR